MAFDEGVPDKRISDDVYTVVPATARSPCVTCVQVAVIDNAKFSGVEGIAERTLDA
jgi:hypothetical protein